MTDIIYNVKEKTSNRGTGAGGANTNVKGKKFENKTSNLTRLLSDGYKKVKLGGKNRMFYLIKEGDYTIVYVEQSSFPAYMLSKYGITSFRQPDEAYIITYKDKPPIIKILEKKSQSVDGSVDIKLWSGPSLKREYEIVFDGFVIEYAFAVSEYLEKKIISNELKWTILNKILSESSICVLFGNRSDYFLTLDNWITPPLVEPSIDVASTDVASTDVASTAE
jgi:hypothetical protein